MKPSNPNLIPLIAALLVAAFSLHADEKIVWSEGHGDLAVNYADGQWLWYAEQGQNVAQVIIRLDDVTRTQIPDVPAFSFLGAVGDPIWIIPAGQTAGIPFMGINSEAATRSGTFLNDRFNLHLGSVSGPGDFIMWTTSGTGAPTILMNSRDGITEADKTSVPAPGHFHQNWGFTSPGTYRIGYTARGTLAGQTTPIASDETIYTYEINVLKSGEADVEVAYENGELEFHVHDEITDAEFDAAHVALQAVPASWQTVPDSTFAFLGEPGASLYVLPQAETEGVLFLGLAAAEVESGVFANDQLAVNLIGVDGPGNLFYYEVDSFGAPTAFFNSADGIDAADTVTVSAGSHAHRNWGFSEPGVYRVTLQAEGARAAGGNVTSEPATFLFEVLPPAFIDRGEIDLEIAFADGAFELGLLDEAAEVEYCANEVVLVAGPLSRTAVPSDPQFSFLGPDGATVYILPQDETEDVLFLGLAADEIEPGVFAGESVELQLASLDGPGDLALYEVDEFGTPTVFWNSSDGLDVGDVFPAAVGSHTHVNWAFTTPGVYRVGLKAAGALAAGNQTVASEAVTFVFHVRAAAPTLIAEGEIDFEVAYEDGALGMGLLDEAAEREYAPADVILVSQPAARQVVPSNAEFRFLGTPGSAAYVLPQDETEGLLFLGIAGDEIEAGVFADETVRLELVSVSGPGEFALYDVDSFGSPTVFMNTRDGISSADVFPITVGSHTHVNWAFSQSGEYQISFKASGTPMADNQPVESEAVTLTFRIENGEDSGLVLAAQLVNNGTQLHIGWKSRGGVSYQLQSRAILGRGDWADDGTAIPGDGGPQMITVENGGETLKVFQIVEVEP